MKNESLELANGQKVPVEVIPVGGAVNNTEIIDMSPLIDTPLGKFTSSQLASFYDHLKSSFEVNECKQGYKVVKKSVFEGNQKFKKGTNEPLLDGDNNPMFYPDSYFAVIELDSVQHHIRVTKDEFDKIQEGRSYKFLGEAKSLEKDGVKYIGIKYTSVVVG